jgi:hypothetical protein
MEKYDGTWAETVRLVESRVLARAFTGLDLGHYGLKAYPTEAVAVAEPIKAAPELADAYFRVTGSFVDQVGRLCGRYHRFLYKHKENGALEVWLQRMEVDAERRGGLRGFRRRGIETLRNDNFQRARSNGGGVAGAYVLASEGFGFDLERLPGYGAGIGLAEGDETRSLPLEGDLVKLLVERITAAAVKDGRISLAEAATVLQAEPRSPQELLAFRESRLSWRLLTTARYPHVLEM